MWLVWYVGGWLLKIPEVLVLKDRVVAGHFSDDDLKAARDAIGARIQTFLRARGKLRIRIFSDDLLIVIDCFLALLRHELCSSFRKIFRLRFFAGCH